MAVTDQLDQHERDMLAREVAADGHEWKDYGYEQVPRMSFFAGWDAAMAHMKQENESREAWCWVCRSRHQLTAKNCPAMDGIQ